MTSTQRSRPSGGAGRQLDHSDTTIVTPAARFRPRRISDLNPAAEWAGQQALATIRGQWALDAVAEVLNALGGEAQ